MDRKRKSTDGSEHDLRRALRTTRRAALFALLAAVSIWGALAYRADHHIFAWDDAVEVAVVALMGAEAADTDDGRIVERFLGRAGPPRRNLREIESWLCAEYTRHTGKRRPAVRLHALGPLRLEAAPPELPRENASFFERLRKTRRFLAFFETVARRPNLDLSSYDVAVFVYFYDPENGKRRRILQKRDSVASRRDRLGVVFAPLCEDVLGHASALVAHELCHTLGAADKYRDGISIYPQGYVEPDRTPLYPQPKAEVMAMGRPIRPGKDEIIIDLEDCAIGRATAREIGWIGGK